MSFIAPLTQSASLGALLAALEDGAAARLTAFSGQHAPCRSDLLQQLRLLPNLHTLKWSIAPGSDAAQLADGLSALPPSLTSLNMAVAYGASSALVTLTIAATLQAVGAAASAGGLPRLQCLTARHLRVRVIGSVREVGTADIHSGEPRAWLEGLQHLTSLTALCELALPTCSGTLGADEAQRMHVPLSQLPKLHALTVGARCSTAGLAALARVRPWTTLGFCDFASDDAGDSVQDGAVGDWTFPALRTLSLLYGPTILMQHMEQLVVRSPMLTQVTCGGARSHVALSIPAAATASQAAADLRRLQLLHERHLLDCLVVCGTRRSPSPLPPVPVLRAAAAQVGPLALPVVETLMVSNLGSCAFTDQHLHWLLALLPNVHTLELSSCYVLTGRGMLIALQHMQHMRHMRHMLQQQQPVSCERPTRVGLSGQLPGLLWEGLCSWAAALPAGQHTPLEVVVKAKLGDMKPGRQAGITLTHMLRLTGRGYVTVRCGDDDSDEEDSSR